MSIAFIGVQRLVTKMVNTCSAFYEPSNGLFSSYSSSTTNVSSTSSTSNFPYYPYSSHSAVHPELVRVNPSPCAPNQIMRKEQLKTQGSALAHSALVTKTATIPLRVMRVIDHGSSASHAGRMVMSGRFADVCAELDRLAERQNKQLSITK
jgi:hypothetical protein